MELRTTSARGSDTNCRGLFNQVSSRRGRQADRRKVCDFSSHRRIVLSACHYLRSSLTLGITTWCNCCDPGCIIALGCCTNSGVSSSSSCQWHRRRASIPEFPRESLSGSPAGSTGSAQYPVWSRAASAADMRSLQSRYLFEGTGRLWGG